MTSHKYELDRLLDAATSINAILQAHDYPETIVMREELDGALAEYYKVVGRTEMFHPEPNPMPSPERILEAMEALATVYVGVKPREPGIETMQTLSELRKAVKG